jgi:hypothetical protein
MVIDVIGSLFDQILADPKVPPQMARQIARLQLPVLRAALGDPSFFSSRKHPVRRLRQPHRLAGRGLRRLRRCGPALPGLVRELVQEIVDRRLRADRGLRAEAGGAGELRRRAGAARGARARRDPAALLAEQGRRPAAAAALRAAPAGALQALAGAGLRARLPEPRSGARC